MMPNLDPAVHHRNYSSSLFFLFFSLFCFSFSSSLQSPFCTISATLCSWFLQPSKVCFFYFFSFVYAGCKCACLATISFVWPVYPRISPLPTAPKWRRKIDSPLVEAAVDDFINKILQDFMVDLWYSAITPDKEAPDQVLMLIKDLTGEISGRIKQINLVDLLTRDMVNLIGDHLNLYRRNQTSIGVDVLGTLSSEERDEWLRYHLIASKELHPALFSSECEYKVLQRLMAGVLAAVLRLREAECPLVRSLGREFLTCLVMRPIMNFASPG